MLCCITACCAAAASLPSSETYPCTFVITGADLHKAGGMQCISAAYPSSAHLDTRSCVDHIFAGKNSCPGSDVHAHTHDSILLPCAGLQLSSSMPLRLQLSWVARMSAMLICPMHVRAGLRVAECAGTSPTPCVWRLSGTAA